MNWMRRLGLPVAMLAVMLAGCGPKRPTAPSTGASGGTSSGTAASTPGSDARRPGLTVRFLDIGQGDAALAQWDGGAALIDGGPQDPDDTLQKDLRRFGVKRLTYVIATHPHEDHIGGLIDVLRQVPVDHFLDSGYNEGSPIQARLLRQMKARNIDFRLARAGESVQMADDLTFRFYAPPATLLTDTDADANNNSVVGLMTYGQTRVLFTGDIEEDGRDAMIRFLGGKPGGMDALRADVLKVAHHGSHNGTDSEFLGLVQPRYAVISCARGNRYGHPHREALQALQEANVALFRTDKQGIITMNSDGRTITFATERTANGSLWAAGRTRRGKAAARRSRTY